MEIMLDRFTQTKHQLIGGLAIAETPYALTLEDIYRGGLKIKHKTCIPPGRYQIKLATTTGMAVRYNAGYPWHQGMLELQDVPNFTYIYLHPGIHEGHTSGCVLVSNGITLSNGNYRLKGGIAAYKALSLRCYKGFDNAEKVWITIQ